MDSVLINLVEWWEKWRESVSLGLSLTTWFLSFTFTPVYFGLIRMATYWIMFIQLSYFIMVVFLNKRVWDFMFHEVRHTARVCSILMFIIFWSIFFFDRELIFPLSEDRVPGLNILQHLLPPILLLADTHQYRDRPPQFKFSLVIVSAYVLLILAWYLYNKTWPYIFMQSLTFGSFQILVIIVVFLAWFIHHVLCYPFYAPKI